MVESKKPPHTATSRGSASRVRQARDTPKAGTAAARIAACEAGLAKATREISELRLSMEAVLAAVDELRARPPATGVRRPKMPPPLPYDGGHDVITVDERDVTLESIRPKKMR